MSKRFATSPADLPTPQETLGMSGLEFMQAVLAGEIPGPPIGQTLGYELLSVEEGRAVFRGAPSFEKTNPMGTVHGGWYGTLLDSAMACAVMTRVPKGSVYTTLEYKVNILRPIPLGMMIDCVGTTDHVGRSTGVAHGEIRGVEDGKLYATGSTTCIVMTPR
ncbi:PaaI family thioesterase [Aliishimia ponticola]|uniref:PaaI family thioesterase n=1 Tax=Aliishimia ponticola TaxID=2499833 RepID=A0A4S4NMA1_9RHOB|nr:PaaI family thioesterase [Aliishimia ponticola]THH37360.1 PaaI family thioesterase [Aliishimia ponticola]